MNISKTERHNLHWTIGINRSTTATIKTTHSLKMDVMVGQSGGIGEMNTSSPSKNIDK